MRHASIAPALAGVVLLLWPLGAMAERRPSDCGYYTNWNGGAIARQCGGTMQAPPPQRVTAMCRDGTYSYDQGNAVCWFRGGVAIWRH